LEFTARTAPTIMLRVHTNMRLTINIAAYATLAALVLSGRGKPDAKREAERVYEGALETLERAEAALVERPYM
jgi:hypothetical protein